VGDAGADPPPHAATAANIPAAKPRKTTIRVIVRHYTGRRFESPSRFIRTSKKMSGTMGSGAATYEFGPFTLDSGKRLLFRDGALVAILPKALDLLVFLIQQRSRLVDKDEILQAVWPGTFVSEANLTQNVSVLRKTLGEGPREHRFIVTLPGRGYRFAADVREVLPSLGDRARAARLAEKARHLLNKRLTETILEAVAGFIAATDEDPEYAPAWVGLSDAYALLSLYGASMPAAVFPKAKAAAQAALRFDATLASAHNALGVVELFYEWNWAAAEQAFEKAIALDPQYGDAQQRYGLYLTAMGRFDEARLALARAQELDPLSRIIPTIAGYPAYYGRDYQGAARQFRHVLQIDPNFSMAHFRLGLTLAQMGDYAGALAELATSKQLSNDRDVVAAQGRVHAMMGDHDAARAAMAELHERSKSTFVPSYALAVLEAALGRADEAFRWLQRSVAERSYWIIFLRVDPALDPLRGDPRFDAIERAVEGHRVATD
jgi:DNA-binding winged helix-turn-helix (wHTH) protein/Tfp pilus assembly protein PilF